MIELVDCHIHTVFSDGTSGVEENVRAAIAAGLTTIAFTDHLARPSFMDCSIAESDLRSYQEEVALARQTFPEIDIVLGFEADWYPGCEADLKQLRGSATFLLGSVHYVDGLPIDYDEDMRAWDNWGADEVWSRYARAWCEACACPAPFHSMAHPDLPRLFASRGYAPSRPLDRLWSDMAEAARAANVRIEVSTAGLRKNPRSCYPEEGLLQRFFEAGVPLTVGSDAHGKEAVAFGIEKAYRLAARIGYRSIDVPLPDGGWRSVSLAG